VLTDIIQFVGPNQALQIFGVKLLGFTADNGKKLLFTICFIGLALLLKTVLKALTSVLIRGSVEDEHRRFWTHQGLKVFIAAVLIIGIASIWFDDPTRLTTAAGLVSAGLAFALQRVVSAVAGYFVILRGDIFSVGDRIVMGGVRGDVIGLNFTQTTIMEMGQAPAEQSDAPSMWVRERQYTGRVVNVSNSRIFEDPVYNYTREFPFIWDEMVLPIDFHADRAAAERILLDSAMRHTIRIAELGEEALREMERRYFMKREDLRPRVYWRLTEGFLELTVRS
jgi:small-conductance mechanosensitive channel